MGFHTQWEWSTIYRYTPYSHNGIYLICIHTEPVVFAFVPSEHLILYTSIRIKIKTYRSIGMLYAHHFVWDSSREYFFISYIIYYYQMGSHSESESYTIETKTEYCFIDIWAIYRHWYTESHQNLLFSQNNSTANKHKMKCKNIFSINSIKNNDIMFDWIRHISELLVPSCSFNFISYGSGGSFYSLFIFIWTLRLYYFSHYIYSMG